MVYLRRIGGDGQQAGRGVRGADAAQAGEKYPVMRTDDLVGAVWLPGDGKANPADITQALAKGARKEACASSRRRA